MPRKLIYKPGGKITVNCHFTPTRMAIINIKQVVSRTWRNGGPDELLGECEVGQPLWEQSGGSSESKHRVTTCSAVLWAQIQKQGMQDLKRDLHTHVHSSKFATAEGGNTPAVVNR